MSYKAEAIVLKKHGGPEQLCLAEVDVPAPAPGEVRVRQDAIGLNFHDAYVRSGLYKTLTLPGIPGIEAAGQIDAVGDGVVDFRVGDQVAYINPAYGAYASARVIAANKLIRLPPSIDTRLAAAIMIKALTVHMLLTKLKPLGKDDVCLVHAAAGGVGRLLTQWAHHIGARVIGTVGTPEKAAIARANGCSDVIIYTAEDFAAATLRLTHGRGVDVVYDSVGNDTFEGSLAVLAACGYLVNFGQSSGPVAPFAPARLAAKSNAVWRPILFHYIDDAVERQAMADKVFAAIRDGILKVGTSAEFALRDVAEAHRLMESRATTGSTILLP